MHFCSPDTISFLSAVQASPAIQLDMSDCPPSLPLTANVRTGHW